MTAWHSTDPIGAASSVQPVASVGNAAQPVKKVCGPTFSWFESEEADEDVDEAETRDEEVSCSLEVGRPTADSFDVENSGLFSRNS